MRDNDDKRGRGDPPRSRLDEEILEILGRADRPVSLKDHVRRRARRDRWRRVTEGVGRASRLGAGGMLLACFIAAFVATLVRDSSMLLARVLAIASVVLLFAPLVLRYGSPRQPTIKQWRGREIDLRPPPPEWIENLRDRFRRPPRR